MELKLLSKKETEELEKNTIRIENVVMYQRPYNDYLLKIQLWYWANGLTAALPQKQINAKLIELIGYEPNYFKQYEYRNAVWGLEWESEKFLIYKSKGGTEIQISPDFPKIKLEKFLKSLMIKLKADKEFTA